MADKLCTRFLNSVVPRLELEPPSNSRTFTRATAGACGDVAALYDINLQIEAGEVFGVIGPSGAGKTSLIRLVSLLERPTSGRLKGRET